MRVIEIMKTPNGQIVSSIILALGLACMLRIACKDANMIIVKGPPLESVKDKIFNFDNKCYSYKTIATSCKNIVNNKNE